MSSSLVKLKSSGKQAPKKLYSYDEYLAGFPETNQPMELWDGEVVMSLSPNFRHQEIALAFYRELFEWVHARQLGKVIAAPMDMVLSPHRAVQPDVAFVSADRLHIIKDRIRGAADLVAEVISLGGRQRDRLEKKDLYEQYGVREYWLIDPEAKTIEVFALADRQYEVAARAGYGETAQSRLLPGFQISAEMLFVS